MKTTGVFRMNRFNINVNSLTEPITIIPFGDVHYGAHNHASKIFDNFLSWAKTKKNAYFIGMGDYLDAHSTSERHILNGGLHETTIEDLQNMMQLRTREFGKKIEFMKGRIIGLVEGNHYSVMRDNRTTTQYLCDMLGCEYLGVESFSKLNIQRDKCKLSVWVYAHHGIGGGGKLVGSSLNALETVAGWANADIYLMGHSHKSAYGRKDRLDPRDGREGPVLKQREGILMRTKSFQKGREDRMASHVSDCAMGPTPLGWQSITIQLRRNEEDGFTYSLEATL